MTSSDPSEAAEEERESHENRFEWYVEIPNLQTIASFQVALSVWHSFLWRTRHKKGSYYQYGEFDRLAENLNLVNGYRDECHSMIASLNTPTLIQNLIKECFGNILVKIKKWLEKENYVKSFCLLRKNEVVNCIVWFPNGKIDYKKSAANICRTSVLSPTDNFTMMSKYCLKDDIEKFDLDSLPSDFHSEISSFSWFIVDYWQFYLKNSLHKIPLNGFSNVDAAMAAKCGKFHSVVFDYFWNRLNKDDQIAVARFWLTDQDGRRYAQCRILSKMTWDQQQVLLGEIPTDIILNFHQSMNFHRNPKLSEGRLWAWKLSRHMITLDEFAELISNMNFIHPTEEFIALIWDTIPKHLENFIVSSAEQRINRFFNEISPNGIDFTLLLKYYPRKNAEFWKNMVLSNVSEFANYCLNDPRPMIEFVKLTLPDPDELAKFKKSLADSKITQYSSLRLLSTGNLDYLNVKLEFCFSDQKSVREYKKDLLNQTRALERETYYVNLARWYEMSAFIDEAFYPDASLALARKKNFILTYAKCWPHKDDNSIGNESIENLIRVVEMVFAEEDLPMIKKYFMLSFVKFYSGTWWYMGHGNKKFIFYSFVRKFVLEWCLNNDENAIGEFKRRLPLEIVSKKCFGVLELELYTTPFVFENIDLFLKFYLGDEQAIKQYKWDAITGSVCAKLIDRIVRQKDRNTLRELYKWALGSDSDITAVLRTIKSMKLKLAIKRLLNTSGADPDSNFWRRFE